MRTSSDFGRADRSLALINAGETGSSILAIGVGAIIVMTTMTITFIERTREFGVLAAIGWSRKRVMGMVIAEALTIGLIGAAGGVALSFAATQLIGQLPSLVGILHPDLHRGRVLAGALHRRRDEPARRLLPGRPGRPAVADGGVAP